MTATAIAEHWRHHRMRGAMLARARALDDVLGPSTPPQTGFEFLGEDPSFPEIGPLQLRRFCSAPGSQKATSLFVTSGLSDPGRGSLAIDNTTDDRFSGLGIELGLTVIDDENTDAWAQHLLADVALAVVAKNEPAMVGDLIALDDGVGQSPDDTAAFSHVVVVEGGPHRTRLVLPTGHCVILHVVGLFEDEVDALTQHPRGFPAAIPPRLFSLGLRRHSTHRRLTIANEL